VPPLAAGGRGQARQLLHGFPARLTLRGPQGDPSPANIHPSRATHKNDRDRNPLAVWYVKTTVAQRGGRGEMYD
jgi:hypothetical protein